MVQMSTQRVANKPRGTSQNGPMTRQRGDSEKGVRFEKSQETATQRGDTADRIRKTLTKRSMFGDKTFLGSSFLGEIEAGDEMQWSRPEEGRLLNFNVKGCYRDALEVCEEAGVNVPENLLDEHYAALNLSASKQKSGRRMSVFARNKELYGRIRASICNLDCYYDQRERYEDEISVSKPPPLMDETLRKSLTVHDRLEIHRERVEQSTKWLNQAQKEREQKASVIDEEDEEEHMVGERRQDKFVRGRSHAMTDHSEIVSSICKFDLVTRQSTFNLLKFLHDDQEVRKSFWNVDESRSLQTFQVEPTERLYITKQTIHKIEEILPNCGKLDLSQIDTISLRTIHALQRGLKDHMQFRVTSLCLSNVMLQDQHVILLAEALGENYRLKRLDLSHNKITQASAISIAEMLTENDTLIEVELGFNHLQTKGCMDIFAQIHQNTCLQSLGLGSNLIGKDTTDSGLQCAKYIVEEVILRFSMHNRLAHLDLSNNYFGPATFPIFSKAIHSKRLLGLHLGGNASCVTYCNGQGLVTFKNSPGEIAIPRHRDADRAVSFIDRREPLCPPYDRPFHENAICWVCDGWQLRKFWFQADDDLEIVKGRPIYLQIDGFMLPIELACCDENDDDENEEEEVLEKKDSRIWSREVMVPPGIVRYWFTNGLMTPHEILLSRDQPSHEMAHILRLPYRRQSLQFWGTETKRMDQLTWRVDRSVFAGIGCQGLWNFPRPGNGDDLLEMDAVHEFLVKTRRMEDETCFDRDWQHVLHHPLVRDHFGDHMVPENQLANIDLSLEKRFQFPGCNDTVEQFKDCLRQVYPILVAIYQLYGENIDHFLKILNLEGSKTPTISTFVGAVLWCAMDRYEQDVAKCDPKVELGLGFALKRFVQETLASLTDFSFLDPDRFRREELYSFNVDNLFREHEKFLKEVFETFSSNNAQLLTQDGFLEMVRYFGLLNSVCTEEKVQIVFAQSLPFQPFSVGDEKSALRVGLKFPRFQEALARLVRFAVMLPIQSELKFLQAKTVYEFYDHLHFIQKCIDEQIRGINLWDMFDSRTNFHIDPLEINLSKLLSYMTDRSNNSSLERIKLKPVRLDPPPEDLLPRHRAALCVETFFAKQYEDDPQRSKMAYQDRFDVRIF